MAINFSLMTLVHHAIQIDSGISSHRRSNSSMDVPYREATALRFGVWLFCDGVRGYLCPLHPLLYGGGSTGDQSTSVVLLQECLELLGCHHHYGRYLTQIQVYVAFAVCYLSNRSSCDYQYFLFLFFNCALIIIR